MNDFAKLPGFRDIEDAAKRIAPYVIHTPLLRSPAVDAQVGGLLLLKAECLQPTGSFKVRGAYNRLLRLAREKTRVSVVAWSAGNHGQALARAGHQLGIPITIVMPIDAPRVKIERTRRWGAQIRLYDRATDSREEIGRTIARDSGATIVPPFDDGDIIAGQGTAAAEALRDAAAMGLHVDQLFCCTGGGGLIAGCALAAEVLAPSIHVHSVEPENYDDTRRSLIAGRCVENASSAPSICDALMTKSPGAMPFEINRSRLAEGLVVNDDQVRSAIRLSLEEYRIVVEPGGAAALAAAIAEPERVRGKTTIVMVTGGNLDLATLAKVLDGP